MPKVCKTLKRKSDGKTAKVCRNVPKKKPRKKYKRMYA